MPLVPLLYFIFHAGSLSVEDFEKMEPFLLHLE